MKAAHSGNSLIGKGRLSEQGLWKGRLQLQLNRGDLGVVCREVRTDSVGVNLTKWEGNGKGKEKRPEHEKRRREARKGARGGAYIFKDKALLAEKDINSIENWQWFLPNTIKIDTFH